MIENILVYLVSWFLAFNYMKSKEHVCLRGSISLVIAWGVLITFVSIKQYLA